MTFTINPHYLVFTIGCLFGIGLTILAAYLLARADARRKKEDQQE